MWFTSSHSDISGVLCSLNAHLARFASRDADSAVIRVHEDWSVSLMTGVQDVGQGSDTLFAQIVAEELGLRFVVAHRRDTVISATQLSSGRSRVAAVVAAACFSLYGEVVVAKNRPFTSSFVRLLQSKAAITD